ncbi:unnamed protein product, partial [Mesorhabditis spiculigera]
MRRWALTLALICLVALFRGGSAQKSSDSTTVATTTTSGSSSTPSDGSSSTATNAAVVSSTTDASSGTGGTSQSVGSSTSGAPRPSTSSGVPVSLTSPGSTPTVPSGQTTPSAGSTQSGSTSNPASPGSTVTTQAPTTQPIDVTQVLWTVPLDDTDPTTLLQQIAALNATVMGLKQKISTLFDNVNGQNNSLIDQLNAYNVTIQNIALDSDALMKEINNSKIEFAASNSFAAMVLQQMACMKSSPCAVPPTPPAPTATACIGNQDATNTRRSSPPDDPLELSVSFGKLKKLTILDAVSGKELTGFKTDGSPQELKTTAVLVNYQDDDSTGGQNLTVTYLTYNVCTDFKCENGGTCFVDSGLPHCKCEICFSGEHCEAETNPCTGSQVNRNCKEINGQQKCVPDTSGGTCDWKCECTPPYHNPAGGNNKTCVDTLESRWFRW